MVLCFLGGLCRVYRDPGSRKRSRAHYRTVKAGIPGLRV